LTLGIIGGLGAMAGVRMAETLVQLAQERGASSDEQFPRFILLNAPLKGMGATGFIGNGESIRSGLHHAVKMLSRMDCEYIVVACNTAHTFFSELNSLTHSEVLNMIDIACDAAADCKKAGVLCSESTRQLRLYEQAMAERHIIPVRATNAEQDMINQVIGNVIAGDNAISDSNLLETVIDSMIKRGAKKAIIGCTELPIALCLPSKPWLKDVVIDAGRAVMARALSLL
jgi:aspartate racemase